MSINITKRSMYLKYILQKHRGTKTKHKDEDKDDEKKEKKDKEKKKEKKDKTDVEEKEHKKDKDKKKKLYKKITFYFTMTYFKKRAEPPISRDAITCYSTRGNLRVEKLKNIFPTYSSFSIFVIDL
ncbi:hypothetical protein MtrunA17_Chr5g0412121 [Medicago truncatula]|uniref:Uncharacterized protein n=1 Tax=Medicago truncatula TaxID=3880 RepID=A0A396HNK9_MEDTR|nr:hypothetical protein MtrunA17_Chr5g0412121 [Medicago truncatula]